MLLAKLRLAIGIYREIRDHWVTCQVHSVFVTMTAKDVILVLASIYIVRCDHACVTTLIPRDLVLITNYNSKVLTQKLSIDASGFCS